MLGAARWCVCAVLFGCTMGEASSDFDRTRSKSGDSEASDDVAGDADDDASASRASEAERDAAAKPGDATKASAKERLDAASGADVAFASRIDAAEARGDAGADVLAAPDAWAARCPDCCQDGFPRGERRTEARLITPFTPSPEGVTVCANGDVLVALDGNGEIWRVPLDGSAPERRASVGQRQPAGLTCDEQGRLFVAIFAIRDGAPSPPGVVMIAEKAASPEVLPAPPGPELTGLNGIVAVAGLGVYASDTASGRIVRYSEVEPGKFEASEAATDLLFPNGLAFDGTSHTLYVVQSPLQNVLAFEVAADGSLGAPREAWGGNELLGFTDGVAVDEAGTLYMASYLSGTVLRGANSEVVAQIPSPASLAFRGGTLLATDYKLFDPEARGGLYAIDLGACGAQPP